MLQRDSQQEGLQDSHHGNVLMVCIHNKVCTDLRATNLLQNCWKVWKPVAVYVVCPTMRCVRQQTLP